LFQPSLSDAEFEWLANAALVPGKSLHLAVALCFLVRGRRTRQVEIGNLAANQFGLDRNSKYRALAWLESAGLVRVERKIGRSPLVTILYRETGDGERAQPA
jgi:hypothetical protein